MDPEYLPPRATDCLCEADGVYDGSSRPACDVGGEGLSPLSSALGWGLGSEYNWRVREVILSSSF